MDLAGFRLRKLAPDDGPAVAALVAASPDTGMVRFRPDYKVDPYIALTFPGHERGVIAERVGGSDLVGLGMLRIGKAMVRGTERSFGLLHSLVVHPGARRHGLAGALIGWRLNRVRDALGEDAVVVATIQKGNAGSLAAASRWATQFTAPMSGVAIGVKTSLPPVPEGLRIRPAAADDLEAFAAGHAAFHADFELWPSVDAFRLADWLDRSPVPGVRISQLWVAEDEQGNLLAGLGTTEVRRFAILQVDSMPLGMRAMNSLIRVVPASGILEQVAINWLWFRDDADEAARVLFEIVRWEARTRGNVVIVAFDPRSRLRAMVRSPWWLPKTQFSLAIRSPEPLQPDGLIDSVQ